MFAADEVNQRLLTIEELNKLIDEGSENDLWEALRQVAIFDPLLANAFSHWEQTRMPRQRMLMLVVYEMVRRHLIVMEKFSETVALQTRPMLMRKGKDGKLTFIDSDS